jgi:hypothetical protein
MMTHHLTPLQFFARQPAATLICRNTRQEDLSGNNSSEESQTQAGALPPAGSSSHAAQQQAIEIGSPFSVPLDDPTTTTTNAQISIG